MEIRARGIFNRVPTTKKSSKSTQNGFIERTFSIWLFNKLNNNAFLPAYLSKSLDKRERPSNSIETILNPMDNRQDWIRLTKLDKHSCAWEIPIVDWNDIVEYFLIRYFILFIHQDLDFENNHKSILLLEKTLLWFIELQFIFSQYFISNFNSISSKLYIKQLRILNFRTKVKTIFSLVSQKRTTTEKWLTTHISDSLMENHLTSREKKFKINSNSSSSIPSSNVVDQNDERKKSQTNKDETIINFIDYHEKFFYHNHANLYSFFFHPFLDYLNNLNLNSYTSIPSKTTVQPSYKINQNKFQGNHNYREYVIENFANLNQPISQINLILTLEGIVRDSYL